MSYMWIEFELITHEVVVVVVEVVEVVVERTD